MKRTLLLCVLAVGATGCGITTQMYQREMDEMRDKVANAREAQDDAVRQREACQRELMAMSQRGATTNANLQRALARVDQLEKLAMRQRAEFDRLREGLRRQIEGGQLSVEMVRGQLTISIGEKILFDSGRANLKRSAAETLREVARVLADVTERRYQVAGHTDTVGSTRFNWTLSGRRADTVMGFLIDNGVPPAQVSYAGYGQFQPTASNELPDGRQENRRVEIVLVPDIEEIMNIVEESMPPKMPEGAPR